VWGILNNREHTRDQSFTYDRLNRLVSAQNAGTNCTATVLNGKTEYWGNTYGYDAWGNLLAKTVTKCGAENLSVTAFANNRLSGYSYDAAGNMTNDGLGHSLTYDAESRITQINSGAVQYTYDPAIGRVRKDVSGQPSTEYYYFGNEIVAEQNVSTSAWTNYVFFGGDRVARREYPSGDVSYYFSDHLKTASVITDAAGTVKAESDYYPWGGELQFVANDSNHYKFTGKERDSESGLDYFGARYYSNALGRFMNPDWAAKPTAVPYAEFGNPQSLNLYGFVGGNPASKADADGHCAGDECKDITVAVKVTTSPAFRINEKQADGTYETGVRGQLTITLSQNGKPMANVPVQEKITAKVTKNGSEKKWNPVIEPKPIPTNAAGQVKDDVGLQLPTAQPASKALSDAIKTDQETNSFTFQSTQTLTFPGSNGKTCSCTYQRTLTNVDSSGNLSKKTNPSGSNYTLTTSTTHPKVKEEK
jgi:RHS repeat-associated protein